MKVAITDYTFPSLDIETRQLESIGASVASNQCKSFEDLVALTHDADVVMTQFARIDASVIRRMSKAKAIVRYGVGFDNVDLKTARDRQIPVCNVPDFCVDEVADHTLGMMLAVTRRLWTNGLTVRNGNWGLAVPLKHMRTLKDCTVGIVGFGRIGQAVAARLAAFQCRRLVFDPIVSVDMITKANCESVGLDQLLHHADIVTLHCPSNESTKNMINADSLSRMKDGAILVNTGRGDLVATDAFLAALQSGKLSGAAIDVFNPEPIPENHPIRKLDHVLINAHVASASDAAVKKLRETAAQIACLALQGNELPNVVN